MLKSTKITKFFLAGALLLLAAIPAQAADLRYQSGNRGILDIPASDLVHNLYAAGSQVIVNTNPGKDAVVAGGSVDINGNTADDLIAAGGNVNVKGTVGGSARIAGGTIHIDSKLIQNDLVIAGGTVYIGSDTVVNGDLLVVGGNVFSQGQINGNVISNGISLTLDGKVSGNIKAKESQYLELGSKADVKGNIDYMAGTEIFRDKDAKVGGELTFTPYPKARIGGLAGVLTIAFLVKLLGEILAAFILFALFKNRFTEYMHDFRTTNFWKNLGIGFLGAIIVPITAAILIFTLVGYYIAFALAAWYILMVLLAWLLAASFFGSWLIAKVNREEMKVNYFTIGVGVLLAGIIKVIPLIGWIFFVIMFLAGFGSLVRHARRSVK